MSQLPMGKNGHELLIEEEEQNREVVMTMQEQNNSNSSQATASNCTTTTAEPETEWSPEKEEQQAAEGLKSHNGHYVPEYDEADEEDGEEEEEDDEDAHLYSEGSDVEYTDYENEEMVQYQAAVDAGLVDEERQCWVCFASDEDDPTATWVHPCRCSGTTKWVHHVCIQRWVDEKQKGITDSGNTTAGVSCPQCGTAYIIKFPSSGPIMRVVDAADLLVGRLCPYVAGGIGVGSLYWTCVTFGAVTVMQVAGHDEGLMLMESTDPLVLLITLPLVPVGLMIGKMVRWQEPIIRVLREYLPRVPLTRYLLPAFAKEPDRESSGAAASLPSSSGIYQSVPLIQSPCSIK